MPFFYRRKRDDGSTIWRTHGSIHRWCHSLEVMTSIEDQSKGETLWIYYAVSNLLNREPAGKASSRRSLGRYTRYWQYYHSDSLKPRLHTVSEMSIYHTRKHQCFQAKVRSLRACSRQRVKSNRTKRYSQTSTKCFVWQSTPVNTGGLSR